MNNLHRFIISYCIFFYYCIILIILSFGAEPVISSINIYARNPNSLSSHLSSSKLSSIDKELEDVVYKKITKAIADLYKKNDSDRKEVRLISHPGFPFNVGVDQWSTGTYRGSVQTYSAPPIINWFSTSRMETITDVPSLSSTWFHVYICGSDSIEIPNFKIVFEKSHKHMQLQLDYLSREDLLSDPSLQYYDKFFV